jgi:hypothetical protein
MLHDKNTDGRNPLHESLNSCGFSEQIFIDLTNLSIREKVDLNGEDLKNTTILDIALSKNFRHLSVHLMKNGAKTNIARPAEFLRTCQSDFILKDQEAFKEQLNETLNRKPLVAMGQLNNLYLEIKKNTIITPMNFTSSGIHFFKRSSQLDKAHDKVLSGLKELYDTKLQEALAIYPADDLKKLINNQKLSKKVDKPTAQLMGDESCKINSKMI